MLLKALFLIARRSLQQHRLAAAITAFSIALATALILTISSLQHQAVRVLTGQTGGFDGVLGARGSALQLVLCCLYHLESSPGNLAWDQYLAVRRNPWVKQAVPIALGDNYLGFRIVGTTPDYFAAWGSGLRLARGVAFQAEGEAVLGSWVARRSGLQPGDRFHPYHGLDYDPKAQHEEEYRVVGILEPTNSPQDRVILMPLEGIYRMSGHVLRGQGHDYTPRPDQPIPEEAREVSGVLIKLKSPQAGMQLDQLINKQNHSATLAWPIARIVTELFSRFQWCIGLLEWTTRLILVVAAASVTASLCNTLHERRKEFAILRALGASRLFLAGVISLESLQITLVGLLAGGLLHFGLLWLLTGWLRSRTGIHFDPLAWHSGLLTIPLGGLLLGLLSGLVPTWLTYRGSLAPNLR